MMKKIAWLLFSLVGYGFSMTAILGFMIFLLGSFPLLSVDDGEIYFLPWLMNTLLVLAFALQHTVMARSGFKAWLTKRVPRYAERSVYVLLSSLLLLLMMIGWQPVEGVVWSFDSTLAVWVLYGFYALGWSILFMATFQIDHWQLFGLKQAVTQFTARIEAGELTSFVTPLMYRFVRHPMMTGMLILLWATPEMSLSRAHLAVLMTLYILVGTVFEEKDLESEFGELYRRYKSRVPKLLPFKFNRRLD